VVEDELDGEGRFAGGTSSEDDNLVLSAHFELLDWRKGVFVCIALLVKLEACLVMLLHGEQLLLSPKARQEKQQERKNCSVKGEA
jgi:hypothetical protein